MVYRLAPVAVAALFSGSLMAEPFPCESTTCCYDYGVNPPVFSEGCGFYASASFLYWKAYQDENSWGVKVIPDGNDIANIQENVTQFKGKTSFKDVDYCWDGGVEVAVGYQLPCDKWAIQAKWTYYDTSAYSSANLNPGYVDPAFLIGNEVLLNANAVQYSGEGRGNWKLCFNQIDLDLRRDFYVGCNLHITPYFGARALLIEQNYTINITSVSIIDFPSPIVPDVDSRVFYHSKLKSDFYSVGLKGGLGAVYEVMCGFGIYGDFGLSLLWGRNDQTHDLSARLLEVRVDNGNVIFDGDGFNTVEKDFDALRPVFDLALGLMWKYDFNCNRCSLFVKGGWEHHAYFYQNGFLTVEQLADDGTLPHPRSNCGNLYLYGLNLSVGVNF